MGQENGLSEDSLESKMKDERLDQRKAEIKIKEMCEKLLVNLIIEDYKIVKI